MTDKELIRRALMGNQEAQAQCTEKRIALPCPFCGSENIVISNWGLWRVWCQVCLGKSDDQLSQADAIKKWNTRPAPPVGRCRDCFQYHSEGPGVGYCNMDDQGREETNFCSEFEPKED